MRVLVTGGYGFVGRHLANHLVECGDDLALTYHPGADIEKKEALGYEKNSEAISIPKTVQSFALDVSDREAVFQLIELVKPDAICHLAAISSIQKVESDLDLAYRVNFNGTLNILDAISKFSRDTRLLYVSSSEAYGEPRPGVLPFVESSEFRPITSYGVSKAAADVACFKYSVKERIHVVRARPFPHVGPGQSDRFAISSFAKQLAMIKLGKKEPIVRVGNLEAKRDYSDVSDIVRGYREALYNGITGNAYNFCSGESIEIRTILDRLIEISEVDVEVIIDKDRYRSVDIADSKGSFEKASKELGWKPRILFDDTLTSLLAHWLEVLS